MPSSHHRARIHHARPVADLHDQPQVVADVEQGRVELLAQPGDQVDHRRLHRHVERGGGFVEQEQRRIREHRHGDDDALLLAARDLVRVAAHHLVGVGHVHVPQHVDAAVARLPVRDALVDDEHLLELRADGEAGVQGAHRLLVDHGDPGAADVAQFLVRHGRHVAALEPDRSLHDAAVVAQIVHDRHGDGGLAAAGFAHQPVAFAPLQPEREIRHRRNLADAGEVGDADVLDLEDDVVVGPVGHGVSPSSRFRAGRRPAD